MKEWERLKTVHTWHRKVEHNYIGAMSPSLLDRGMAVPGFRHDLEVVTSLDHPAQQPTHVGNVVGDQDPFRHLDSFLAIRIVAPSDSGGKA
jgi:hypothetical protein